MITFKMDGHSSDDVHFPEVIFNLSEDASLNDALDAIEMFLRCTYNFDGTLEVVNTEEQ